MEKIIEKIKQKRETIIQTVNKEFKFDIKEFKFEDKNLNNKEFNLVYLENKNHPFVFGRFAFKVSLTYSVDFQGYDTESIKKYYNLVIYPILICKKDESFYYESLRSASDLSEDNLRKLTEGSSVEILQGDAVKKYLDFLDSKYITENEEIFFDNKKTSKKGYTFSDKHLMSFYLFDGEIMTKKQFIKIPDLIIYSEIKHRVNNISITKSESESIYKNKKFNKNYIFLHSNFYSKYCFLEKPKLKDEVKIKDFITLVNHKDGISTFQKKDVIINFKKKDVTYLKSADFPCVSNHPDCCGAKITHSHYNLRKTRDNNKNYILDESLINSNEFYDIMYLYFCQNSLANLYMHLTDSQLFSLEFYRKIFGENSIKTLTSYYNVNSSNRINVIEVCTPLRGAEFLGFNLTDKQNLDYFSDYDRKNKFVNEFRSRIINQDKKLLPIFQWFENLEEKTETKLSKQKKTMKLKSKFMSYPVNNFRVS